MDNNAKELLKRSGKAFSRKDTFNSLCQTLALQFYPERAQFTTTSYSWGEEFSNHLFDSSPALVRRDLGNAFSAMLRPRGQPWFNMVGDTQVVDYPQDAKTWLYNSTEILRGKLYNRKSGFVRATKEADHDYATFGNAAISVNLDLVQKGLKFKSYHLSDCAWLENEDGEIDTFFRKFKLTKRQAEKMFNRQTDSLPNDFSRCKDVDKEFNFLHILMPIDEYEYKSGKAQKNAEYASIYVMEKEQHIVREVSSFEFDYVVPRWQTISGSPYAISPAALISLPDARTLQAMQRCILDAAEKAVDPPIKATQDAVLSEINLYGGGITWVDAQYDEKLGPAMELLHNKGTVGIGMDALIRVVATIQEAWYITKLNLPTRGQRTAYETAQLVEEFIRQSTPLFEPMESEYNGKLLEVSTQKLLRVNAFGEAPESVGEEVNFSFSNPLQDAIKRAKVSQFEVVLNTTAGAAQLDPNVIDNINWDEAVRDTTDGVGAPPKWLRPMEGEGSVDEIRQRKAEAAEAQAAAQEADAAGQAMQSVGAGLDAMSAEEPPQNG